MLRKDCVQYRGFRVGKDKDVCTLPNGEERETHTDTMSFEPWAQRDARRIAKQRGRILEMLKGVFQHVLRLAGAAGCGEAGVETGVRAARSCKPPRELPVPSWWHAPSSRAGGAACHVREWQWVFLYIVVVRPSLVVFFLCTALGREITLPNFL